MNPPAPLHLSPENLSELLGRLDSAREALASQPEARLIEAWTSAASHFRAVLNSTASTKIAATTGFCEPDVRNYLMHIFSAYADPARWADWIRREMGEASALDVPRRSGRQIAFGAGHPRALVVQGGGIPLTSLPVLAALSIARTPIAVRIGRRDPISLSLFLRSAANTSPLLARSIIPVALEHKEPSLVRQAFGVFPLVVAFGSNEAIAEMNAFVSPPARFISLGSRFSLAWVTRSSIRLSSRESPRRSHSLVRRLARDILMFDKQGCYSVQGVIVPSGSYATLCNFCEKLLEALVAEWVPRRHNLFLLGAGLSVKSSLARWAQFGIRRVITSPSAPYPVVVLMKGSRLPPPSDGPIAWVLPVSSESHGLGLFRPYRDFLSTLVVAAPPADRLRSLTLFSSAGFSRFCEPGSAQYPDPFAPHDGLPLISALSRVSSMET
jgi:hypothetical protein